MNAAARVLQILFLIAGVLALFVALMITALTFQATNEVEGFGWNCATGDDRVQRCGTTDDITYTSRGSDAAVVCALAGVGLVIASASVAIGGRRQPAAGVPDAQPYAASQQYAASPYTAPQQYVSPGSFPHQQPGPQQ